MFFLMKNTFGAHKFRVLAPPHRIVQALYGRRFSLRVLLPVHPQKVPTFSLIAVVLRRQRQPLKGGLLSPLRELISANSGREQSRGDAADCLMN